MRVLVVACFDSFLRAGRAYARHLERAGARVDYAIPFARPGQISAEQFRALGFERSLAAESIESITVKERLARYDVILLGLDGLRTRRFVVRFARMWGAGDVRRPVTVSLYPGLVFRFHLEGMQSRMSCDLFLLNSPRDHRLYTEMLAALGSNQDNAMCAGLSFLPGSGATGRPPPSTDGAIVFVDQPTVPAGGLERRYVIAELVALARRFPHTRIVVKPRHRPTETTLHQTRYHCQQLLEERARSERLPANLELRYESMEAVLETTRLCVTFSSTAALEALARGIPTRILTDLGINENLGNQFFFGSGLFCDFADLRPDLPFVLERAWFDDTARSIADNLAQVAARIDDLVERQRHAGRALPLPNPRLFGRAPPFTEYVERTSG